ncbi:hypothetical protein FOA52_015080 [Chlamydomonas sp. UWO 241]|nr:hypothetical protein FOA52_015080 [Chlamydomonas sp. UWO 241]
MSSLAEEVEYEDEDFIQEDDVSAASDGDDATLEARIAEEHGKYKAQRADTRERLAADKPWLPAPIESPGFERVLAVAAERAAAGPPLDLPEDDGGDTDAPGGAASRAEYVPPERTQLALHPNADAGAYLSYLGAPRPGSRPSSRPGSATRPGSAGSRLAIASSGSIAKARLLGEIAEEDVRSNASDQVTSPSPVSIAAAAAAAAAAASTSTSHRSKASTSTSDRSGACGGNSNNATTGKWVVDGAGPEDDDDDDDDIAEDDGESSVDVPAAVPAADDELETASEDELSAFRRRAPNPAPPVPADGEEQEEDEEQDEDSIKDPGVGYFADFGEAEEEGKAETEAMPALRPWAASQRRPSKAPVPVGVAPAASATHDNDDDDEGWERSLRGGFGGGGQQAGRSGRQTAGRGGGGGSRGGGAGEGAAGPGNDDWHVRLSTPTRPSDMELQGEDSAGGVILAASTGTDSMHTVLSLTSRGSAGRQRPARAGGGWGGGAHGELLPAPDGYAPADDYPQFYAGFYPSDGKGRGGFFGDHDDGAPPDATGTATVNVGGRQVSVYMSDTTKRVAEANRWLAQLGYTSRYRLKSPYSAAQIQLVSGHAQPQPLDDVDDSLDGCASEAGASVATGTPGWGGDPQLAARKPVVKTLTFTKFVTAHARLKGQAAAARAGQQRDGGGYNAGGGGWAAVGGGGGGGGGDAVPAIGTSRSERFREDWLLGAGGGGGGVGSAGDRGVADAPAAVPGLTREQAGQVARDVQWHVRDAAARARDLAQHIAALRTGEY